jgi:HSP20 family protein
VERWQPFRTISDIQSEMNRLFDSVFGHPATMPSGERMWIPLCDMWETRDEVALCFELPGVSEKDVSVSITGDLLTVKGERRFAHEDVKSDDWHRLERAYGKFERTVQLPMPVQANKVKATYRDGLLTVTLPKAEEVKPKEIKIDIL